MNDYVVSAGGNYALSFSALDAVEAVARAKTLVAGSSQREYRLHTAGEWRELCDRNRLASTDAEMARVGAECRRKEAMAAGLPFVA